MISFPIHSKSEPAESNSNFLSFYQQDERTPPQSERESAHGRVRFSGYVNAMQRQARNNLLGKLYELQLATPLDDRAIKKVSLEYAELADRAKRSGEFFEFHRGEFEKKWGKF